MWLHTHTHTHTHLHHPSPHPHSTEETRDFEKVLSHKLRQIMLEQDLEETTSKQLRLLLENEVGMELKEYREFLDRQMLRILGQMERPSQIYEYLFLVRVCGV